VDEPFDAILLVSFGGPERPEDVMPFLEQVTAGRNVPRDRLEAVAEHYHRFGGKSPINDQSRALIAALRERLAEAGPDLPIYWGNRNWHPFLADAIRDMERGGVRRALAFVTSAYGSYSGCRQYREDIEKARAQVGAAARIEKLRSFHDHPGFVEPMAERVRAAREGLPPGSPVVFTAHSIPVSMAASSPYVAQLEATCRLVAERTGAERFSLAWQSRSGPPQVPWLEPDVLAVLRALHDEGVTDVTVAPIGFLSDHMEVIYDLDIEARALADELGLRMHRAATVGTHPRFVEMIRELIVERIAGAPEFRCAPECCVQPRGRRIT
jgi:ferrochelatase